MSNAKIQQALNNLFEKQRIVFWYDTQHEFVRTSRPSDCPASEDRTRQQRIRVKHRVLRELSEQKFLLYRDGPEPAHLETGCWTYS